MKKIVFEDYQQMIRKIAHKKANQFPSIEFEELEGRGGLLFVQALEKFDSQKGSFSTFFWRVLNNEMVVWERGHGKIYQPQLGLEDTVQDVPSGVSPEEFFEFVDTLEKMTEEAKDVIHVIFSAPAEIMEGSGPKHRAGNLRKKLKSLGWTEWVIASRFREIREALAS